MNTKYLKMKKILFVAIVMLLSTTIAKAQEEQKEGKEKLYVQLKDDAKPTIYVNGKIFDFPMELIDQEKIASVSIFKGKLAIEKYNAPNGIVLIKTKDIETTTISKVKEEKENKVIGDKKKPMVIVDGKVADRNVLDEIAPSNIEKMEVFKGEQAIKKYNAPNGVIIITTKKQ